MSWLDRLIIKAMIRWMGVRKTLLILKEMREDKRCR